VPPKSGLPRKTHWKTAPQGQGVCLSKNDWLVRLTQEKVNYMKMYGTWGRGDSFPLIRDLGAR